MDGGLAGRRRFGPATRPPLDRVQAVNRLAELGAAVTFPDHDLVRNDASRSATMQRIQAAPHETGLNVEMVTTNLFHTPCFKESAFTPNDRQVLLGVR